MMKPLLRKPLSMKLTNTEFQKMTESGFIATARNVLFTNAWLEDSLIDIGQTMLKAKCPHVKGLQSVFSCREICPHSTAWRVCVGFESEWKSLDCCIQHWLPSCYWQCFWYSTCCSSKTSHWRCAADQILGVHTAICWCAMASIAYYCGLFVLANATSPCNGLDPTPKMRSYLLPCFEIGDLKPFPIRGRIQASLCGEGGCTVCVGSLMMDCRYPVPVLCRMVSHYVCSELQRCVSSKHQFHGYATNASKGSTTCLAIVTTCK